MAHASAWQGLEGSTGKEVGLVPATPATETLPSSTVPPYGQSGPRNPRPAAERGIQQKGLQGSSGIQAGTEGKWVFRGRVYRGSGGTGQGAYHLARDRVQHGPGPAPVAHHVVPGVPLRAAAGRLAHLHPAKDLRILKGLQLLRCEVCRVQLEVLGAGLLTEAIIVLRAQGGDG